MNKSVFKEGTTKHRQTVCWPLKNSAKSIVTFCKQSGAHLGLLEIQQTSECLQKPPMYASLILNPLISGN